MDPITTAAVVKTVMSLWLVVYTPTQACLQRDSAANTVKILVGQKTDGKAIYELARRPGAAAPPAERSEFVRMWTKAKPNFVKTDCYDVRAGLVKRVRMPVLHDPIKVAAAMAKKAAKGKTAAKAKPKPKKKSKAAAHYDKKGRKLKGGSKKG